MSTAVPIGEVAHTRTPRRWPVAAAVAAPVLFLCGQVVLEWRHIALSQAIAAQHGLRPFDITARDVVARIGYGLVLYLALAAGGMVLARRGYRYAWAAPAVIYVLGTAIGAGHYPKTIGTAWTIPMSIDGEPIAHWYAQLWGGAISDLALVLLPALPFLLAGDLPPFVRRFGRADVLALLVVATGIAIVLRGNAIVNDSIAGPVVLATAIAFGLLAGTARPWWPWVTVLVSLAVAGTLGSLLWVAVSQPAAEAATASVWVQMTGLLPDAAPVVACALIASFWEPLANALRRSAASAA